MTWEIGLMSTIVSSQPGSVSGSTKPLLTKTSGNSAMKPAFITAFGARSSRPSVVKAHERPKAKATTTSIAPTTPSTPPSGR